MIKVSVLIPAYNAEKFLSRSVGSVLGQTYDNWELIIGNDGSTDRTLEIAQKYAEISDKVKVLDFKENEGVGMMRIKLLKAATGDFVCFLDSDDELDTMFLDVNVKLQAQHDSDVVYTKVRVKYAQEGIDKDLPNMGGEYLLENEGTVQPYFSSQLKFICGKLFRRSLCDKIKWCEGRIAEDVNTLFYLLYEADKVRVSEVPTYIHVFREGSLLANASQFLCVCGSAYAELDIIFFCYEKGNLKIAKFLLERTIKNWKNIKKEVKKGTYSKEDLKKYNDWYCKVKARMESIKNKRIFKEILNYEE